MTGKALAARHPLRGKVRGRENELKRSFDDDKFDEYKEIVKKTAQAKAERRATLEHIGRKALGAIVVAALVASATYVIHVTHPPFLYADGWYIALAGVLGASLGGSELVSRYRDEPLNAVASWAGLTYVSMNALVSACAYGLLARYSADIIPQLGDDKILRAILAGFGAMAILRSKFFTLRTEKGEDIGVGPDAALSAFLSAADRGVDRKRAGKRLKLVFNRVATLNEGHDSPDDSVTLPIKDFIRVSLSAFQNLSEQDKAAIKEKMHEIYETKREEYPSEELKLQALCYEILVIAGEYNFSRLMKNLEKFLGHVYRADLVRRQEEEEKEKEELLKEVLHGRTVGKAG
jgi:hypothetical protein